MFDRCGLRIDDDQLNFPLANDGWRKSTVAERLNQQRSRNLSLAERRDKFVRTFGGRQRNREWSTRRQTSGGVGFHIELFRPQFIAGARVNQLKRTSQVRLGCQPIGLNVKRPGFARREDEGLAIRSHA
ncbi:MAG: hypothetical protein HYV60_06955 [Planctomycetia bacterium]|nr:hypothetical protein [Planctomycetia bacterium]